MGRKRLDYVKKDVKLSIDPRLLEEINKLKYNKSALFTDKVIEILKQHDIDLDFLDTNETKGPLS